MQEIINYITTQRQAGMSDEQIKAALRQAGHTEEQIDRYFTNVTDVGKVMVPEPYQQVDKQLFRDWHVIVGALFLLLPGFYLRYRNYRAIGEMFLAKLMLILGFISLSIVIISGEILGDSIDLLIWLGIAVVIIFTQQRVLEDHKKNNGQFHTFGTAIKYILPLGILSWILAALITYGIYWLDVNTSLDMNLSEKSRDEFIEIYNATSQPTDQFDNAVVDVADTPNQWLLFESSELGIKFHYPPEWGQAEVREGYGAPAGSGLEHQNCQLDMELSGTAACTGALIGFNKNGEEFRPFLSLHGIYMHIAPQGGWWGFLQLPNDRNSWSENPLIINKPATSLLRFEHGGDTRVQFIEFNNTTLSHGVIASALEAGKVSQTSLEAFFNHLETMPPPPAYGSEEEEGLLLENYRENVEAFDVSDDYVVEDYIRMLSTIRLLN